jgi:hypothetical protein
LRKELGFDESEYAKTDFIGEFLYIKKNANDKFNKNGDQLCSDQDCSIILAPRQLKNQNSNEKKHCGIHYNLLQTKKCGLYPNKIIQNQKFRHELYEKLKEMHLHDLQIKIETLVDKNKEQVSIGW